MAKNATQPSLSKGRIQCFCPEHLPARPGLQEDAVWLGLRLSTNRVLSQRRSIAAPYAAGTRMPCFKSGGCTRNLSHLQETLRYLHKDVIFLPVGEPLKNYLFSSVSKSKWLNQLCPFHSPLFFFLAAPRSLQYLSCRTRDWTWATAVNGPTES